MQKNILYGLLLILVASSCHRETDNNPTPDPAKKCRLVRMIQGTHNGAGTDTTFLFSYDASGKITKITYQNPGYNENYDNVVTYDDSGHITKVSAYQWTTFKYTGGVLTDMYSMKFSDSIRRRFVYGSSSMPEKCIEYQRSFVTKQWDSVEHRYTVQNGNITSLEAFVGGISKNKVNYEYDTLPNVNAAVSLVSQWTVPLGWFEEVLPFNKNMLKKKTLTTSSSTYVGQGYSLAYKTDSGKVVQSDFNWTPIPPNTQASGNTRYYYYECQ